VGAQRLPALGIRLHAALRTTGCVLKLRYMLPAHCSKTAQERAAAGLMDPDELMTSQLQRRCDCPLAEDRIAPVGTHLPQAGPAAPTSTRPAALSAPARAQCRAKGFGHAQRSLGALLSPLAGATELAGVATVDETGAGLDVHSREKQPAVAGEDGAGAGAKPPSASAAFRLGGSVVASSLDGPGPVQLQLSVADHSLSKSEPAAASFNYASLGGAVDRYTGQLLPQSVRPRELPVGDLAAAYVSATGDVGLCAVGRLPGTAAAHLRLRVRLFAFPDLARYAPVGSAAAKATVGAGWVLLPTSTSVTATLHAAAKRAARDLLAFLQPLGVAAAAALMAAHPELRRGSDVVLGVCDALRFDPLSVDGPRQRRWRRTPGRPSVPRARAPIAGRALTGPACARLR
jgi:hypothetical protein